MSGWIQTKKTEQQLREERAQMDRFNSFNDTAAANHYQEPGQMSRSQAHVPWQAKTYGSRTWPPVRGALDDSDDEVEH